MVRKCGKQLVSGCSKKDLVWVVGVLDSGGDSNYICTPYDGKVRVYPSSVSEFTGFVDDDGSMVFTGSIIENLDIDSYSCGMYGVVFKGYDGKYKVRYFEDFYSLESVLNYGGVVSGNLFNKSDEYQKRFKELFGDFSLDELLSNEDKVKRLLYSIFHEGSDN